MTVLGQYRFLNNAATGTQAAILFGLKVPSGRTGLVDLFGELFEAEFQPGSGSWDGLFGAAFSQQLNPAWSLHANVLGIVNGTGTQDTYLGNRFLYNAALAYRVFGETAGEPHARPSRRPCTRGPPGVSRRSPLGYRGSPPRIGSLAQYAAMH